MDSLLAAMRDAAEQETHRSAEDGEEGETPPDRGLDEPGSSGDHERGQEMGSAARGGTVSDGPEGTGPGPVTEEEARAALQRMLALLRGGGDGVGEAVGDVVVDAEIQQLLTA